MARRSVSALAAILGLGACVPEREVAVTVPAGAHTLLLFARRGADTEVDVFDLDRPGGIAVLRTVGRAAPTQIWAASFAEPLGALQLSQGPLAPAPGAPQRLLPRPLSVRTTLLDGEPAAWTDVDAPDFVRDFPLPALDWSRCVGEGGCPELADDGTAAPDIRRALCTSPCPALEEVTPVAAATRPQPPALPVLTPCPEGWDERPPASGDDVATCEPSPLPAPASCPAATVQFRGEAACAELDPACPAGPWRDDLDQLGAPVLYVLPGAAAGGTGTRAAPFARLSDALERAPTGAVVAIGPGTIAEPVLVPPGVALVGACAARTTLSLSAAGALEVGSGAVTLRGLHLVGELSVANAGTLLAAEGLLVDAGGGDGIVVGGGAALFAHGLVIRGASGRALLVTAGGAAEVEHAVIEGCRGVAAVVDQASRLALRDVAVRGTGRVAGLAAIAVEALGGGALEAHGVAIERTAGVAVEVSQGSRATLAALDVAGAEVGVRVALGAGAAVSEASIVDTSSAALAVSGAASTATIARALLRPRRSMGRGVVVGSGASATARALHVDGASVSALGVTDRGTLAAGSVLLDHLDGAGGPVRGLAAEHARRVTITRGLITRTRGDGLAASATEVSLADLTVRDTGLRVGAEDSGLSLWAHGGRLSAERLHLARGRLGGLVLDGAVTASVADVTIEDMAAGAASGSGGFGVACLGGCALAAARLSVARTHAAGITVNGAARAALEDVTVADTAVEPLAGAGGDGIIVADDGRVVARRAAISRSARDACYLRGGTLEAEDLELEGAGGHGLSSDHQSSLSAARVRVSGAARCALSLRAETDAVIRDLGVPADVTAAPGRADLCVREQARVKLDRFQLASAAATGLLCETGDGALADAVDLVLTEGRISGHSVGVSLVVAPASLAFDRVDLSGNRAPITGP